jgi:hypothetical protein
MWDVFFHFKQALVKYLKDHGMGYADSVGSGLQARYGGWRIGHRYYVFCPGM